MPAATLPRPPRPLTAGGEALGMGVAVAERRGWPRGRLPASGCGPSRAASGPAPNSARSLMPGTAHSRLGQEHWAPAAETGARTLSSLVFSAGARARPLSPRLEPLSPKARSAHLGRGCGSDKTETGETWEMAPPAPWPVRGQGGSWPEVVASPTWSRSSPPRSWYMR